MTRRLVTLMAAIAAVTILAKVSHVNAEEEKEKEVIPALAASSAEKDAGETKKSSDDAERSKGVTEDEAEEGDDSRRRALFGSYRTITRTGVSLATSTVFVSCLSGISAGKLCTGRRRKRDIVSKLALTSKDHELSHLTGSHDDQKSPAVEEAEDARLLPGIYTVWTTATASTTVTVRYTDTATTVSLSFYCTAQNIEYPTIFC